MTDSENDYVEMDDINFQEKIYKKREFHYNKVGERPNINNYDEIVDYRNKLCSACGEIELYDHQRIISNYINPDTPNNGCLVFYTVGAGKTCVAITAAEEFKPLVTKYNTKIYVLVPGQTLKASWKRQIITCTGDAYIAQNHNKYMMLSDAENQKLKKLAIANAANYYRFMTYNSFYKRVLGERVIDKKIVSGNKIRNIYKKTDKGQYERDINIDKIHNLNNTLIIVDEAHNLTGNIFGKALREIIDNSTNLKVLLLTATPMSNLADDIIELINFIRPKNDPIERDKIFNSNMNHFMDFREGGLEYFSNKIRGYVSCLRGDPFIFAKRIDVGEMVEPLKFTKIIKCRMENFQYTAYKDAMKEIYNSFDRKTESVANFVFPVIANERITNGKSGEIVGYYGCEGLNILRNQLKSNSNLINKLIATKVLNAPDTQDYVYPTDNGKTITGKILHEDYLINFSTKFYKALTELNKLVIGDKGPKLAFVYSNLVRVGIELFKEVLKMNGYLEYEEIYKNYKIMPDTKCYYCGKIYKNHTKTTDSNNDTDSHEFKPATFITFTGKTADDQQDALPEKKIEIIYDVFNNIENKNGKYIKFVLGSVVMNEGVSLWNVSEVHILDVYYNLGRVEQVVGRATRNCSHHKMIDEHNKFPEVKVYKYAVVMDNFVSSEIDLYIKAEMKYALVKKVERCMKENAFDCPLMYRGNVYPEEVNEYKNCVSYWDKNTNDDSVMCPAHCDFTSCEFKCSDKSLNEKYYDPLTKNYVQIPKDKLDYSTFTDNLMKEYVINAKDKIKELYTIEFVYTLDKIIEYVKKSYKPHKRETFEEFFVYKALDELIPTTENELNNFSDTVYDKFGRPGYLIYVDMYYLFQPFDQNENSSMYFRTTQQYTSQNKLSLLNYLKYNKKIQESDDSKSNNALLTQKNEYEYDMDYYDSKPEAKYVGVIDKEPSKRVNEEPTDTFKLREARKKNETKKRGIGIQKLTGNVCMTVKNKQYLIDIAKHLKININSSFTKNELCDTIKNKLLDLEKYTTDNITYVMIPKNHKIYPFPYNIHDRAKLIEKECKEKNEKCSVSFKNNKYTITINGNKMIID